MVKPKKAPSLHARPKKGESQEAFTKRVTDEWIKAEQKYRKDNKLPPLTESK
jgi:hypothetical protein